MFSYFWSAEVISFAGLGSQEPVICPEGEEDKHGSECAKEPGEKQSHAQLHGHLSGVCVCVCVVCVVEQTRSLRQPSRQCVPTINIPSVNSSFSEEGEVGLGCRVLESWCWSPTGF